jgi:hypothetical protein
MSLRFIVCVSLLYFVDGSHEEWLKESPCNELWWNLDQLTTTNKYHERNNQIDILENSLNTLNISKCWFLFKVYHKLADLYYTNGRFTEAINTEYKSLNNAKSLYFNPENRDQHHPSTIIILPSLSLMNMFHRSGPGTFSMQLYEKKLWDTIMKGSNNDRSLNIVSASHVPWNIPTEEDGIEWYKFMNIELNTLLNDSRMDCLYYNNSNNNDDETEIDILTIEQCNTRPQNYSNWYPHYGTFYHLFDAQDILLISMKISNLYFRSTRSLTWVAPHLQTSSSSFSSSFSSFSSSSPSSSPSSSIKIGFISSMFNYGHSLGQHIRGVINELKVVDHYEIFLIHLGERQHSLDSTTSGDILIGGDIFLVHDISYLPSQREYIANLRLDVLIYPEIGMDANTYFLSFSRLAPVR